MTRIRIFNHLGSEIGDMLRAHPAAPEVLEPEEGAPPWIFPEDIDVLVTQASLGWNKAPLDWPPPANLAWVQTFSAGIDAYPRALLRNRIVTTGRGQASDPIADYVMTAILARLRPLQDLRARSCADWEWPELPRISDQVIGLFGYGSIGKAIGRRALAFGMKVVAYRRGAWDVVPEGISIATDFHDLMRRADHLVLAAPLTEETQGIINDQTLANAKPGQHLVNISRGGLVDQMALVRTLDEGRLSAVTLDVTDPEPLPDGHPLYARDAVLITPHLSWIGGDAMGLFKEKLVHNLTAWLAGGADMIDRVDTSKNY